MRFPILATMAAILLPTSTLAQSSPAQLQMEAVMAFCNNNETLDPSNVELTLHQVSRGQSLGTIARDHAVDGSGGRCLARLNEAVLAPAFVSRCSDVQWTADDGYYCNEARGNDNFPAWANSLLPGDEVFIISGLPETSTGIGGDVTRQVNIAVNAIKGDSIVLVIDVSGSMGEESDRARVLDLYGQLLGGRVTGIVFYSGQAQFVPADELEEDIFDSWDRSLTGHGAIERVVVALKTAAANGADAIVLIADEPGEDTAGASFADFPPVVAHCLPEGAVSFCDSAFGQIATETGGSAPGQS